MRGKHLVGIKKTSCATCSFFAIDKLWEKKKIPEDFRHECKNSKSFYYERHIHYKDNCNKHEQSATWKPVRANQ